MYGYVWLQSTAASGSSRGWASEGPVIYRLPVCPGMPSGTLQGVGLDEYSSYDERKKALPQNG